VIAAAATPDWGATGINNWTQQRRGASEFPAIRGRRRPFARQLRFFG
jgi:hypothetical protein